MEPVRKSSHPQPSWKTFWPGAIFIVFVIAAMTVNMNLGV